MPFYFVIIIVIVCNTRLITLRYSVLITSGSIHMKIVVSALFRNLSVVNGFSNNITSLLLDGLDTL